MAYFDDDDSQPDGGGFLPGEMAIGAGAPAAPGGRSASDLDALSQKYGFAVDDSDRQAYVNGRGQLGDFDARMQARAAGNGGPSQPASIGQLQMSSGNGGGNQFASPNFMQPFNEQFTAPTAEQALNTPGFQFRLGEAMKAIERSGLAKGTYFMNQTAGALQKQASDMASTEYGNTYDRAFNEYLTKGNIHNQNEQNRYGSQRSNLTDQFGMFDTNRNFDLTKTNADRGYGLAAGAQAFDQNRLTTNDAWNRGQDIWSMGRTDRQDDFTNNLSYADFAARYGLQPPQ